MAEVSIAIADDNRQTLNLLGEILEKENGIRVVGKADNGEDAYNMIVRTNPDIVLIDVIMPRLDGISVMEKVKNNAQMKTCPSLSWSAQPAVRMLQKMRSVSEQITIL